MGAEQGGALLLGELDGVEVSDGGGEVLQELLSVGLVQREPDRVYRIPCFFQLFAKEGEKTSGQEGVCPDLKVLDCEVGRLDSKQRGGKLHRVVFVKGAKG